MVCSAIMGEVVMGGFYGAEEGVGDLVFYEGGSSLLEEHCLLFCS